jgi:hypothetical protein
MCGRGVGRDIGQRMEASGLSMGDIPIQSIVIPFLGLVFVGVFLVYRKRMMAGQEQQHAQYRVGELARRLGLSVVEGDPSFNLFVQYAHVDGARGPADGRPVHVQARLSGEPRGRPLELFFLYRLEQESGLVEVTWRTWFECRMSVTAKQEFPPFEVISKKPPMGPIAMVQALPPVATGNPAVDDSHTVATQEPAMARLLGEVIPAFAVFERGSGIHLVGDGRTVSFRMGRDKAPLLANALYYAEDMAAQLDSLASRVGG